MEAPQYQAPPTPAEDPNLATLNAKAEADKLKALSETASIDTASIMARYGTKLAMAGNTPGSPLAVARA